MNTKPNKKTIEVAVGIMINAKRQVLIAERPVGKPMAGLWEFAGGKLEPGESPYEALVRELKEELGIDVIKAVPWFQTHYDYPEFSVLLHLWQVIDFAGEPAGLEQQQFKWADYQELLAHEFPPANVSIVEALGQLME